MSVDLTSLNISADSIMPLDFGGLMSSALGGATDRLDRLGSRYMAEQNTPPMPIEPDGRKWSARLLRARKEGGIVAIHELDLNVMAPGSPVVATDTPSGRVIPISGLTPYYPIREGKWLNYVIGGQHYLDQCVEEVVADGSGVASVTIQNLLRVPLTAGATLIFAKPVIEGWIEGDFAIPRSVERITSFSFSISEKA